MGIRHKERAKLLWLKRRVALDEAPYLVIDKLDGMYDDAFSLLLEAVKDKRLPADINPETSWDLLDGDVEIIDSVDARKTTVATADLLTWLEPFISQLESQAESPQGSTQQTAPASAATPADWVTTVRDFAKQYIDRHKAQNLFPSQADVCEKAEAYLSEKRIFGSHERPLSAAYIGRNAIQGAWWQQNKP